MKHLGFIVAMAIYFAAVIIGRTQMEIKGYITAQGYMGYVNGKYQLFATENDYLDCIADELISERN